MAVSVVLSLALFIGAHAYQGRLGMLGTGYLGLVFTYATLLSGSILPAIIVHIATNLNAFLFIPAEPTPQPADPTRHPADPTRHPADAAQPAATRPGPAGPEATDRTGSGPIPVATHPGSAGPNAADRAGSGLIPVAGTEVARAGLLEGPTAAPAETPPQGVPLAVRTIRPPAPGK